jgi:hypothetical protein
MLGTDIDSRKSSRLLASWHLRLAILGGSPGINHAARMVPAAQHVDINLRRLADLLQQPTASVEEARELPGRHID